MPHFVALDTGYAVWNAFGNEYWPALYFIDAAGRIRHHHFGEHDYENSERVIQQLLEEAGNHYVPGGFVTASGERVTPKIAAIRGIPPLALYWAPNFSNGE